MLCRPVWVSLLFLSLPLSLSTYPSVAYSRMWCGVCAWPSTKHSQGSRYHRVLEIADTLQGGRRADFFFFCRHVRNTLVAPICAEGYKERTWTWTWAWGRLETTTAFGSSACFILMLMSPCVFRVLCYFATCYLVGPVVFDATWLALVPCCSAGLLPCFTIRLAWYLVIWLVGWHVTLLSGWICYFVVWLVGSSAAWATQGTFVSRLDSIDFGNKARTAPWARKRSSCFVESHSRGLIGPEPKIRGRD